MLIKKVIITINILLGGTGLTNTFMPGLKLCRVTYKCWYSSCIINHNERG